MRKYLYEKAKDDEDKQSNSIEEKSAVRRMNTEKKRNMRNTRRQNETLMQGKSPIYKIQKR